MKSSYHKIWVLIFFLVLSCVTYIFASEKANHNTHQLNEEKFIHINGIDQWVTIKGNSTKPAILFLHGGPGSPLSPYSEKLYGEWEDEFILVQWDQRGSGKTFGRNAPPEITLEYLISNPLSVEQITSDGIALTEYLLKYLGKEKIILFGTSWGTVPGIKMAFKRPDLFTAYVGHSQIVNPSETLTEAYNKVFLLSENAGDKESLEILKSIGAPPYSSARNTGKLMRIIKKYERLRSEPAPDSWMSVAPKYDNTEDQQFRNDGDDYSFLYFAGDEKLGVVSMVAELNMQRDYLHFQIPIYIIQGETDILTPTTVTKSYFDKISAPLKIYKLLPDTAHGFNQSVLRAKYDIFKSIEY